MNNHQRIQLQGWRANCDIQIIIDHHACVEYLAKYAAKGEPRSQQLKDTFNSVIKSADHDTNVKKTIKQLMMKSLGERDFSAQETAHHLLSLKLHSTTFNVKSFSLNGSRRLQPSNDTSNGSCTSDSFLDVYAKRSIFSNEFPDIMNTNFQEFATKYKLTKNKLEQCMSDHIVPNIFPTYSSNPKGQHYSLYCKFQLLRSKPWKNSINDAWGTTEPDDQTYITEWHNFLNTAYAKKHVQNWSQKISDVLENIQLPVYEQSDNQEQHHQEEWMILSDFYKSGEQSNTAPLPHSNYDWTIDSMKYTTQQIGEMPSWINTSKVNFQPTLTQTELIDINSFSEMQKLAYNIITKHSENTSLKEPLLLIINGVTGTGKSYMIRALTSYLQHKCVITATTGKAAYSIRGVTIHSLLKLPITPQSQRDLSGEALIELQHRLSNVDYILIDEYSMLGQKTRGWIDRRCRQSSGVKEHLFGGKSIILIGDPAQLPPVADKPLYHAKPSNPIAEQGYYTYMMFNSVVTLTVNQRVKGSDPEQIVFRDLLLRLRNGETSENDWNLLLTRQPLHANNIEQFKTATRLFYTNEQVAIYNYDSLLQLKQPIAKIDAKHSSSEAAKISPQDMYGLEPSLLISKGALVMLTMNLWPSVGLCNGSAGTVVDIIYKTSHQPPDLPIAVIIKFDDYIGPSISNKIPSLVPIAPVTISVYSGNSVHERQQLPLKLAWALTIHKSQGLTLPQAWVDIGKSEQTLGITYVALSRVKQLSSLIVEPMTFDRLKSINKSANLKYRQEEEHRLKQKSETTKRFFQQ